MRIPPPVYLAGALALQRALAPKRKPSMKRKLAGAALGAVALGLDVWAAKAFRDHHTTVNPITPEKATAIVDDGPFAYTRNPMYVGMAATILAGAVTRGGWLTPLPALAFVAVIDRTQVAAEEAALRERFGAEFDSYAGRVPRWVGLPLAAQREVPGRRSVSSAQTRQG